MMMNAIEALSNTEAMAKLMKPEGNDKSEAKNLLGKDDFMSLLITQLKNQDPLNPLKDTEFIGQLTTFTTLEQLTNMAKTMGEIARKQESVNGAVAASLIGTEVSTKDDERGVVSSVSMKDGNVYLMVKGKETLLSDIREISRPVSVVPVGLEKGATEGDTGPAVGETGLSEIELTA